MACIDPVTTGVISFASTLWSELEKSTFSVSLSGVTVALDWIFKAFENAENPIDTPTTPTTNAMIAITCPDLFFPLFIDLLSILR